MKAVIQRCLSASVAVEGETISSIEKGLLVLVGIGHDDTPSDSSQLIRKILNLRLFDGPAPASSSTANTSTTITGETPLEPPSPTSGKERSTAWKRSVMDIEGEILCVSQFTLMARTEKGSKPDFHQAMPGTSSKPMYEEFLLGLGRAYKPEKIKDGKFAAMMNVSLCNEGPVTILLDTKSPPNPSSQPNSSASSRVGTPALQELTAEEKNERGREKARLSKEKRSKAKIEWEAKKRQEGGNQGDEVPPLSQV